MEVNEMKNIKDNQFANFILEIRNKRDLTQKELAEILNVSDRTISKWENGITVPDLVNIKNICEELNVSPNFVILSHKTFKDYIYSFLQKLKVILDYIFKNIFAIGFIIVFLILILFFINNYNYVNIYTLKYTSDNIAIEHGYLLKSKGQNILFIDNITLNKINYEPIDLHIELYTYVNGDKYLLYESNNLEDIFIEELDSYPVLLKTDVLSAIHKNLYLDISTKDANGKSYTYNSIINLTKKFSNNQISYETFIDNDNYDISFLSYQDNELPQYIVTEDIKINYDKSNNLSSANKLNNLIYKMENIGYSYNPDKNFFIKNMNNGTIYYYENTLISYDKIVDNLKYNIKYYFANNRIEFRINDNNEKLIVNFKYYLDNKNTFCIIGVCENYFSEIEYIINVYDEITETLKL